MEREWRGGASKSRGRGKGCMCNGGEDLGEVGGIQASEWEECATHKLGWVERCVHVQRPDVA
jgi:hypothetical protein